MILTCVLTSLLILICYIGYVVREVGVPPTLSDSFYMVKMKWGFTITLFLSALTLLPAWLEVGTENTQFLSFFCCSALAFIGASPQFRTYPDRTVHMSALVVCISALILWMCLNGTWLWILPILTIGIVISLFNRSRYGFILEMVCFLLAYISVFVKYFN